MFYILLFREVLCNISDRKAFTVNIGPLHLSFFQGDLFCKIYVADQFAIKIEPSKFGAHNRKVKIQTLEVDCIFFTAEFLYLSR